MARESFQFRGTKYFVDDVVDEVSRKIQTDPLNKWCDDLLEKNISKVKEPDWNSPNAKFYGREYLEKQWSDQLSAAKRSATTECLNKAFGSVIGGGCTNNPHAPESIDAINKDVIEKTLSRIRSIRTGTVHRNYSRK